MGIINNVRARRMRTGMSVQHLAEAVGADDSTIRHIECGTADNISFSLIQRLASALKCASVRDLFPGTMCPEISRKDLRAHKRIHRNGAAVNTASDAESQSTERPLKVGDLVTVNELDLHESSFCGEVLEVTDKMFVVRHPKGWKECFHWDEFDGCKVRKYVEGWKVGMP